MNLKAVACSVLLFLLVAVPSVKADWPMFHADPSHSGVGTGSPVLSPTLLWMFTTGDSVNYSPVVANGIVYICSYDGNLYALNAKTGEKIWSYNATIFGIGSSPTVADGIVYVSSGEQNRFLYAFNAYNGDLLWTAFIGTSVTFDSTVVNGVIYLAADGSYNSPSCILAINAKTGVELWNYSSPNPLGCTPAVVNRVVYTASGDGYVHAINADNGQEIWNCTRNEAEFLSAPTVVNGILYVGINGASINTNGFYALNATNGAEIWRYMASDAGNYVLSTAAVYDGTVYVGSRNGDVYAFNAVDGTLLWHITAGHFLFSSPAVIQGLVYIGSGDGNFYSINGTDGTILWNYTINSLPGTFVYSSPAYDYGAVYIGSCDNNLYAFGDYTGPTPNMDQTPLTVDPSPQFSSTPTFEPKSTLNQATSLLESLEVKPNSLILLIAIISTAMMLLTVTVTVLRKRKWTQQSP
jgi:outer membrane protein assembly factor BamB